MFDMRATCADHRPERERDCARETARRGATAERQQRGAGDQRWWRCRGTQTARLGHIGRAQAGQINGETKCAKVQVPPPGGRKRAAPVSRSLWARPTEFPPWDPEGRRQPRLTDSQDPNRKIRNEWAALWEEYRGHYNNALQRGMETVDLLELARIFSRQEELRQQAAAAKAATSRRAVSKARSNTDTTIGELEQSMMQSMEIFRKAKGNLQTEREKSDEAVEATSLFAGAQKLAVTLSTSCLPRLVYKPSSIRR